MTSRPPPAAPAGSLLRPQVFDQPGAASWVVTTADGRALPSWLLFGGSLAGMLALVVAAAGVTHRQEQRLAGVVAPDALQCAPAASGCRLDIALDGTAASRPPLPPGTALALLVDGRPTATVRVLADDAGSAAGHRIRVAWPASRPAPVGRVDVAGAVERSLLGWILPRRREAAP